MANRITKQFRLSFLLGRNRTENNMDLTYTKQLNIRYDVDVFVAGGGPAGIAAAVSCARQGKSVFLAESFSAFGGAAVTMLVPAFMTFGDGERFLAEGIGREVYTRICAQAFPAYRKYCPNAIPVETLKRIYDDMVTDAGVQFLFHTNVIDAVTENRRIRYAICSAKGSLFAVKAKIFIDCTGDGDLAYYAGAEYEYGDENGRTMAATLCGLWSGIEWSRVQKPDGRKLDQAFADGVFTNEDRHLPGMWPISEETGEGIPNGLGGSNAGHIYDVDARESAFLTAGIIQGRKQLLEYRKYYRTYLDGFENAELVYSAPCLGIRESRRILCDYKMVLDDFLNRAVFDDEIGRYCYPVDIHSATNDKTGYETYRKGHTSLRCRAGESYGISYRALAVRGIENLLTAGRCIGADRYMQSSLRVMPGCFITGQAAGIAAAVVCDAPNANIHKADVKAVQRRLISIGAYLPNYTE